MNHKLNCPALSQLPDASIIQGAPKGIYVTLPVIILAFQQFNTSVLLVTDFTEITGLGFAHRQLPQNLPQDFIFRLRQLDHSKVLAIGVPSYRAEHIWDEIRLFGPQMQKYDYRQPEHSNILREGVVAVVNFKLKSYKGYLEGWIGQFTVLNRLKYSTKEGMNDLPPDSFLNFKQLLAKHMDCTLYDSMVASFPVEEFIKRQELPGYKPPTIPGRKLEQNLAPRAVASLPPTKIRRMAPSEAIYREQFSQAPATRTQSLDSSRKIREDIRANQEVPATQFTDIPRPLLRISNRVDSVSFEDFSVFKCHVMKPGTKFRMRCTLAEVMPAAEDLFVKGFKETLLIAQISFVLTNLISLVTVEINTTAEACNFFGFEEVEEAINNIGYLQNTFGLLRSQMVTIEVEAKKISLPTGFSYTYWCPSSTLEELSRFSLKFP
ncbi:hypothetical protein PUMCH_002102 [Australozyma saopauloensis]|uniref:Uncharacterized protein n=1 Tax=Australozyma saopauloensis TaxID=291208 RepID=A0AAX4H8Q9_9ASCO|nr:hypothetical protein PUMCH_002102 [[Candida] saopauloensis]